MQSPRRKKPAETLHLHDHPGEHLGSHVEDIDAFSATSQTPAALHCQCKQNRTQRTRIWSRTKKGSGQSKHQSAEVQDFIKRASAIVPSFVSQSPKHRVAMRGSYLFVFEKRQTNELRVLAVLDIEFAHVFSDFVGVGERIPLVVIDAIARAGRGAWTSRNVSGVSRMGVPEKMQSKWVFLIEGPSAWADFLVATFGKLGAILSRTSLGVHTIRMCDLAPMKNASRTYHLTELQRADVFVADNRAKALFGRSQNLAVKVMANSEQGAYNEEQAAARKEISMLTTVQGHPNIIRVHCMFQFFNDNGTVNPHSWGLLMDECFSDLHARTMRGPFDRAQAIDVTHGLLSALSKLHSSGLTHRDVRPENVLLLSEGHPVLSRFGHAARTDDHIEMACLCGTPGYIAPEVINGFGGNSKLDTFSLGVLLYFCFTRKMLFKGRTVEATLKKTLICKVPLAGEDDLVKVGSDCKSLLRGLLQKNPEIRFSALDGLRSVYVASKYNMVGTEKVTNFLEENEVSQLNSLSRSLRKRNIAKRKTASLLAKARQLDPYSRLMALQNEDGTLGACSLISKPVIANQSLGTSRSSVQTPPAVPAPHEAVVSQLSSASKRGSMNAVRMAIRNTVVDGRKSVTQHLLQSLALSTKGEDGPPSDSMSDSGSSGFDLQTTEGNLDEARDENLPTTCAQEDVHETVVLRRQHRLSRDEQSSEAAHMCNVDLVDDLNEEDRAVINSGTSACVGEKAQLIDGLAPSPPEGPAPKSMPGAFRKLRPTR